LVELLGRYSNIPQPLLSGQPAHALLSIKRPKPVDSPAPRIHALDRRLSPELLQRFLGDYQAGISANRLAARYQLSRSSIRRLLRESEVPRRYQVMTEHEADQAAELYQAGLTISDVAASWTGPGQPSKRRWLGVASSGAAGMTTAHDRAAASELATGLHSWWLKPGG